MATARVAVEWYFGLSTNRFHFIKLKDVQKTLQMPIHEWHMATVLMANIHNCLHPNQISQYFNVKPPSLDDYLNITKP